MGWRIFFGNVVEGFVVDCDGRMPIVGQVSGPLRERCELLSFVDIGVWQETKVRKVWNVVLEGMS